MADEAVTDKNEHNAGDGIDRRGFLECMAWAGTGLVWSMMGGVPTAKLFAQSDSAKPGKVADFTFVQISDSHIGFNKAANQNVAGTLRHAIDLANTGIPGMPAPDFLLHTGDVPRTPRPRNSIPPQSSSKVSRIPPSMSPANTISSTMATSTAADSAKAPSATATTASITRACTSSA